MIKVVMVLGLGAVGLSGVTMAAADLGAPPMLQYGALGLCGTVVYFLCKYLWSITQEHKQERLRLIEELSRKDRENRTLISQNTAAYGRLASLLEERPCLEKDKRRIAAAEPALETE